jgi:acyl carrier protein
MNIQPRIRQFIIDNFYIPDPSEIANDTLLVTNGIVDSTGMLEVIAFIEEQFGIQVADEDTTPENLDSIDRMAAYIARRQQGQGRSAG